MWGARRASNPRRRTARFPTQRVPRVRRCACRDGVTTRDDIGVTVISTVRRCRNKSCHADLAAPLVRFTKRHTRLYERHRAPSSVLGVCSEKIILVTLPRHYFSVGRLWLMDNFVRVEKPLASSLRTTSKKDNHDDEEAIPSVIEWPFVTSESAKELRVDSLSKQQMEQILRLFDLNPSYGPFVGIDRELRWQRAQNAGLHPPLLVKRILDTGDTVAYRKEGRLW